jgi:hypothetical protein
MNATGIPVLPFEATMLRPILIGGTLAGTFDLAVALLIAGRNVPRGIAGGLLGKSALQGGLGIWVLGIVLHYVIALCAAAIYCQASRRLAFLNEHWFVSGLFFGIGVYLVMNLIVLPLSALHTMGPYNHRTLVGGILIHMLFVGLPISFCLHKLT